MTYEVKGYPFEVSMPDGGVVLRNAQPKDTAPDEVLNALAYCWGILLQI